MWYVLIVSVVMVCLDYVLDMVMIEIVNDGVFGGIGLGGFGVWGFVECVMYVYGIVCFEVVDGG